MRVFQWLSTGGIPPAVDLRNCGWRLVPGRQPDRDCVALAHRARMDNWRWAEFPIAHEPETRKLILLIGVSDSDERARLLHMGFGEAMGDEPQLGEVEARAERMARQVRMLPRFRQFGALRLDLLVRDGFADERPLGLHPREFALIWCLADTPGQPVSKQALVKDVWRLHHMPETNSVAVHVSRLREKLRIAGLAEMVQTAPTGGYLLAPPNGWIRPAIPMLTRDSLLDAHTRKANSSGQGAKAGKDGCHEA